MSRNRHRRVTAVFLGVLLVGCGGPGDREKGIEVEYNCPANAAEISSLQGELPLFTKRSGITLNLNPFTGQEKLYAMMAAGQAPDIFYTNTSIRDRLAAEGRLLDLRTVSQGDSFVQRLWPDVIESGKCLDDGWYSLGNWSFTCGVYYNRDTFDSAGVPYPDTGWTWEDMVQAATALTKDNDGDGTTDRYGIFIGSHFIEALEVMNGAKLPRNAVEAVIPKESAEVYKKYLSLMDRGIMPDLRRMQAMGMQAPQMLQSGRVAMLVEAVPHQTLFETLRMRWGIAPLPRFHGKPPLYFRSGSGGLSISSNSRHPAAAWEAVKWIVAGALIYQPNPVLKDVDFIAGWEAKYPGLTGNGFREVWELSLRYNGGDKRFFVRYSSWTASAILERLQPELDRLWSRDLTVEQLKSSLPRINGGVQRALEDAIRNPNILPEFRSSIEHQLEHLRSTSP
ncbi:MAG: extracellular solute-binding protein [Ignavibacteria bacterium]|nr:extracellular solute-binding protein [Ignavibacteria bacterium]